MLWLLPGAMTPLLVHSSAAAATDPDRDRTASRAVRLGILVTLVAAVPLALVAGPLLALLAGGAYADSAAALRALLPGVVAFAPGAVLSGDFIGRGKPHWNTQASLLTVGVNLAAGLLLIPAHGAVGAAWSSTIAYACGSLLMLARFRQTTRLSVRSAFRRRR
jgi:O-antigen/teichoic acid export membrane protein